MPCCADLDPQGEVLLLTAYAVLSSVTGIGANTASQVRSTLHPQTHDMLLAVIPVGLLLVADTTGQVSAGVSFSVWVSAGMCGEEGLCPVMQLGCFPPACPVSQQPLQGPTTLPDLTLFLLPHFLSHLRSNQLLPCLQHCSIWGLPSGWLCSPWSICWPGPWPLAAPYISKTSISSRRWCYTWPPPS